jgi:D-beta-D-heptose 7-phosphate kinase/D-beta-D-heptose 1-phosphate adenosyltransferase
MVISPATVAVAYADIFDYPLTWSEIQTWQTSSRGVDVVALVRARVLEARGEYFFLKGRASLVLKRQERQRASLEKWRIVESVARWLRCIPTLQLVGVTGGLAMDNASEEDDIDLFIVTSHKTLWVSRFVSLIVIHLLGRRRKVGDKEVKNKICLNMFVSTGAMGIPKKEQDLFIAHEVLQMYPLWWRGDAYKKFLQKNEWVKHFLPHAWEQAQEGLSTSTHKQYRHINDKAFVLLEKPLKLFQIWYMKKHRTTEVITDSVLRFHPNDARVWVKQALQQRLRGLDTPLDKIFYHR